MNKVAIAAIDLGKHSFHLHEQDDRGHELCRKKFTRVALIRHLANLDPCTVVMEACGGAHFMTAQRPPIGFTPLFWKWASASLRASNRLTVCRRC